jgi:hypothetical protein
VFIDAIGGKCTSPCEMSGSADDSIVDRGGLVADWKVGPVVVRPAIEALNDARQGRTLGNDEWFDKLGAEQASCAFATVEARTSTRRSMSSPERVDMLRVLQHVRHFTSQLT